MKEQSHKEDMRAAIRGDFERLRARQAGAATAGAPPPPWARRAERVVLTPPSRPAAVTVDPAPAGIPAAGRAEEGAVEPPAAPASVAAPARRDEPPEPEWRPWLRALLRRH